jgi:hypothetical protein
MKYNIEGGIDFYEELYKSLDIDEDNNKTEDDNNLCLITNKELCDKFVEMECGHKFNYIPLYLDIKNHKEKYNGMEGSSTRLNVNEIRCPYCRKRQQGVLPYYEELGLEKITGVNCSDIKKQYQSYEFKKCEYLTPNPNFDPSGNNIIETDVYNNGNCKFYKCHQVGFKIGHTYNGMSAQIENYGDTKCYCWSHQKIVIKQYKKAIADKVKLEAKNAKLLAKEEAKNAKLLAKEEAKNAKQKEKEQKKNKNKENIVLGPAIIMDVSGNIMDISGNNVVEGCVEILKNGVNKGTTCGCKLYQDNMCKRHYSIKNKVTIINLI